MSTKSSGEKAQRSPTKRKALAARSPRKRASKQTTLSSAPAMVSHTVSLVALSPYRFPISVEQIAINTARIGGVALIFGGLIFTYSFLESRTSELVVEATQTASLGALSCAPDCGEAMSQTPSVTFTYDEWTEDFLDILIDVFRAEQVSIYAYDTKTEEYLKLGDAEQIENSKWRLTLDTAEISPGTYWIKAVVTNRYGTYDRSDTKYLVLP